MKIGAYHPLAPGDLAQTKSLQRSIDRPLDILNMFKGWPVASGRFDLKELKKIAKNGSVPMITWEPWDYTQPDLDVVGLPDIVEGYYNAYIRECAKVCANYGQPLYVRFGHEFNGHWYPWSAHGPKVYSLAFRHLVEMFEDEGASNVKWVWCPNAASGNPDWQPWYPGSEYVDVFGLDGYNWPDEDKWRDPDEIFRDSVRVLRELSSSTPILICETGTPEGPGLRDKARWIDQLFAYAGSEKLDGIVWFDAQKEHDWQLNSSPQARRAFIKNAK